MNIGSRGASILVFAVCVVLLFWLRPRFLVDDETGEWKQFGLGPGKSCINVTVVIILLALGAYLLSACVGTSITKWKKRTSQQVPPSPQPSQQGGGSPLPQLQAVTTTTSNPSPIIAPQVGGGPTVAEPFGGAFGGAFSLLQ
jgi:hypothetical protein